jgi:putative tryptophan/tyrosine transport system substrate-binding protein
MTIQRRGFITLLGGAAAAWPLAARAQRRANAVIGYLDAGSTVPGPVMAAFHQGLKETGWIEGQNVTIQFQAAEGQYDRLPALAAELVSRRINVIVAVPTPAAQAAKAATTTIPIVFAVGSDPVEVGLVASLNRPGGNLTGVSFSTAALMKKRIELMHELVPPPALIAVLTNPANELGQSDRQDSQAAALALGRQIRVFDARTADEVGTAFAALVQAGAGSFVLGNDPFLASRREQIAYLAIRHALPAMFPFREYVTAGGMMSYGVVRPEISRQHGIYVGRVLKGEKPADLPVMLPTKFELVINLNVAKAIGFAIPETFLVRANEVIE